MNKRADEITATEAAQRLGITGQALGMWTVRPGAPARKHGRQSLVSWPAFARWREGELVRQALSEAQTGDFEVERTRKMRADASLSELTLAKAQGELVAIADYDTALSKVLDHVMARLRAFPVRLAHFGPDIEAAASTEAERIVVELHNFDEDVIDDPTETEQENDHTKRAT